MRDRQHLVSRLLRTGLPLLLGGIALSACAHSQADATSIPAKESHTMNDTTASIPGNTAPAASEIVKNVARFISGLSSRNDITLEGIFSKTGIRLSKAIGNGDFFYSGPLRDGRIFSLTYVAQKPSRETGFIFEIGGVEPQAGSRCAISFREFDRLLKSLDYRAVDIHGEIGQLQEWRYYKDDIMVSLVPGLSQTDSGNDICIKSIGI